MVRLVFEVEQNVCFDQSIIEKLKKHAKLIIIWLLPEPMTLIELKVKLAAMLLNRHTFVFISRRLILCYKLTKAIDPCLLFMIYQVFQTVTLCSLGCLENHNQT